MLPKKKLNRNGPEVSVLALGCMSMSGFYGPADRAESIATIREAIDAGVTLIDTGDFYGMGHNEMLIAEALKGIPRDKYLLSVKFGGMRAPDGAMVGFDTRPMAVKNFLSYSLQRLATDYIDIYRPARVPFDNPLEDTIGAIGDMIKSGHVRYLGMSEASGETVRKANAMVPVTDLQIEYSLMSRDIEEKTLPICKELGIGITAYGVLASGLISKNTAAGNAAGPGRETRPRFQGENYERNAKLVMALDKLAKEKNTSVVALAIAWVASRGDHVVPLLGSRKRTQLKDALEAATLKLTAQDLAAIEAALPANEVIGTRYPKEHMAGLHR